MKHLIMGTAGHVDHGKTSLIKALTNIDCDTHKEEKRRGITINLGFSHLNLPNGESIGIVDVPGHKDFIDTMVSGACGIDFVLLVIAADSGIMPQTREHVNILTVLGINKGIVALTKTDMVDADLAEMAKSEIHKFLEKSSIKNAPVIGFSSLTGEGKSELIQAIENIISEITEKETGNFFRMYIDRIFSIKGFGNVVTGSVLNGIIETGDEIHVLPGKSTKLKVRSIERHGIATEKIRIGDRAAINLIGLKKEDFKQGMLISNKALPETKIIDACISVFDNETSLQLWTQVTFHSGTFECLARMHCLFQNSENKNEKIIVQIHLQNTAVLINNDKFILRNSSGDRTIGGGSVIDTFPLHHKRVTKKLTETLKQISEKIGNEKKLSDSVLNELKKECRPFTILEIADRLHCSYDEIKNCVNAKSDLHYKCLSDNAEVLIHHDFNTDFKNKIIKILNTFHQENTLIANGLGTIEIIGKLGFSKSKTDEIYLSLLLQEMSTNHLIELKNNTWIIKNHKPENNSKITEELHWLENEIKQYDIQKPAIEEIEERALQKKIQKKILKMYFNVLASEKKIIYSGIDFVHSEIVKKYRLLLLKHIKAKLEGIEINEFRLLTGTSKRLCPILIEIYKSEKIITTQTTGFKVQIFITKKGSDYLYGNIS